MENFDSFCAFDTNRSYIYIHIILYTIGSNRKTECIISLQKCIVIINLLSINVDENKLKTSIVIILLKNTIRFETSILYEIFFFI